MRGGFQINILKHSAYCVLGVLQEYPSSRYILSQTTEGTCVRLQLIAVFVSVLCCGWLFLTASATTLF